MTRSHLLLILKLTVAPALLWWTFHSLDISGLWESIAHVGWTSLGLALVFQFMAYTAGSLRWCLLVVHGGGEVTLRRVQRPYYLGLFFNQFLPSSVGGDAVRALSLYREGVPGRVIVSSALIDRIVGLTVLVWLGGVALYWSGDISLPGPIAQGISLLCVVMPVATVALFHPWSERFIFWVTGPLSMERAKASLANLLRTCRSYGTSARLMILLALCSATLQLCATAVYVAIGHGLGLEIHWLTYLLIVSVVSITASLPISVGGLGVRESVFVGLMVVAGAQREAAAAVAILFLLILWTSVFPGLVFFVKGRGGKCNTRFPASEADDLLSGGGRGSGASVTSLASGGD